ncbi:cytoskeletal protein CcmA (bactofilin family) [Paenibacillus forsythiae]|uniref:Cytoskeletal protein CcmA (Bactofilin family) n=1 Tax=Paenibacillus forsythiae TaxID=365616 RepID=A0ABU3HFT2_9BACL|nr:hypothetical protein [Paenibacillus forsythiae]MDT3428897.1 cytoskeletal protein CcmA (bactofilin family) [Paenibacillus forsythiae]
MQHDQKIIDGADGIPLKVKGSLIKKEDVHRSFVEVIGYLRVTGNMTTSKLKVLGDCSIRNHCQAMQVENLGSLRVQSLQADRVSSSGYLSVSQKAVVDSFQAKGAVRIDNLIATESIDISLSSVCQVGTMKAYRSITVRPSSRAFNYFMRPFSKLRCEMVQAVNVTLYRTEAKLVCGEEIIIGPGCTIREVRYSKSFQADPGSHVENIVLLKE